MAKKPVSASSNKTQTKSSASSAPKGNESNWPKLGLIVLAITAACYLPTLGHDFVNWDDSKNITENPNLQLVGKGIPWSITLPNIFDLEKGAVIGNYNPLPILTFAVEKSLNSGEFSPTLTHAVNLLLHLLTVFFVMKLLSGMGIGRWGVLAGGLLFGIHPMRVESVAWASERKDVLFAMFFFWALVYYVKWLKQAETGESRKRTYWIMLVLALLSCLSKVQAVALPLSMLALDFWFRRPMNFKLIWEKAPFWLLSIAIGLINIYTLRLQGSTDDSALNFNFLDRLCIGAYSYCTYLYKLVVPYPMSPLYPYPTQLPWTVYAAPVGIALVVAGLVWAWLKGNRTVVFGLLFFTFNVMFVLQIFAAGQGFMADRFTYAAYFGLFVIAAYYLDIFSKRENSEKKIYATLGVITLVFGSWTVWQSAIWKDGTTLWTHVMQLQEGDKERSVLPYWNRGKYLLTKGDLEGALRDYTQAIEMDPSNPELTKDRGKTYFNMASSSQYKNQQRALLEKAIQDYTAAMAKPKITPKSKSDALSSRGAAYGFAGMYEQCISDLTESLEMDPTNKTAYANRAVAYLNTNQYEKALKDYEEYVKLDPNNPQMWYECGMMQRTLKHYLHAVKSLENALTLNPKFGLAFLERARTKAGMGNYTEARQDYQKAQQLGVKLEPADLKAMREGGN
ncbi:MAG: tetratricopeptide repeat protein [Phycisphaerae bacterium]|nr:tetratricopeptide repeat protein [Saprospiraceae bacterium]